MRVHVHSYVRSCTNFFINEVYGVSLMKNSTISFSFTINQPNYLFRFILSMSFTSPRFLSRLGVSRTDENLLGGWIFDECRSFHPNRESIAGQRTAQVVGQHFFPTFERKLAAHHGQSTKLGKHAAVCFSRKFLESSKASLGYTGNRHSCHGGLEIGKLWSKYFGECGQINESELAFNIFSYDWTFSCSMCLLLL